MDRRTLKGLWPRIRKNTTHLKGQYDESEIKGTVYTFNENTFNWRRSGFYSGGRGKKKSWSLDNFSSYNRKNRSANAKRPDTSRTLIFWSFNKSKGVNMAHNVALGARGGVAHVGDLNFAHKVMRVREHGRNSS